MSFNPTEWQPEPLRPEERRASGLPASGWLPDPGDPDLERYWDGTRWTGRVRNLYTRIEHGVSPSAYTTPARTWTPAAEPAGVHRRARRRRWRTSVLLLVVVALLGVLWAGRAADAGLLPSWANLGRTAAEALTPTTAPVAPTVDYPVYGSTELVRYLETAMIAQQEAIDVTFWAEELGGPAIEDALREAVTQNPYAFVKGWVFWETTVGVELHPVYTYAVDEADRRRSLTATAVQLGLSASRATAASSDKEKVTRIHDYLVSRGEYDYEAYDAINRGEDNAVVDRSQEAYGLLVEGTAVCNGYAQAFLAMAEAAGLEAVQVTGSDLAGATGGDHAWNKVLVDGEWLLVDVTWDDPSTNPRTSHDYLMLADGDPRLITRITDSDWVVDAHLGDYSS
ncbi:transglutaminase domain-containing protein [Demequina sp. SYSU T00192]|uniref:Transglutaminase domain-containing protein n=1 Tax=Demequina litoralis TaxID=3051660 RepID=A0ABT8GAT0_9MICO|nr:transglutaminase domain-containing protein [Demequina sp. SYSU T00192]MDN4476238.1 transglutaminase domain-containing protein [Demequina sp. SYSU T00192]